MAWVLFCFVLFCFVFKEVPRLGIQTELQLPAYTTATAMPDPSRVCDLHYSSWQCRILNLLSEARDRTCNLMVPSRIHFCFAMTGTPKNGLSRKTGKWIKNCLGHFFFWKKNFFVQQQNTMSIIFDLHRKILKKVNLQISEGLHHFSSGLLQILWISNHLLLKPLLDHHLCWFFSFQLQIISNRLSFLEVF